MTGKASGRLGTDAISSVAGEQVHAYIPPSLPPRPALDLEPLYEKLEAANRAL